jgi:hypothetical protein
MRRGYHRGMSMRRRTRPVAPDQTALAVGLSGLALTVTSALVRAVVTGGATVWPWRPRYLAWAASAA